MRTHRRSSYALIMAGIVVLAVAVPGTALAKGPTAASIDGPGLAQPIALDWDQRESDLIDLIDATGFWELAEPQTVDEPAGDLGSRYVISFSVHDDTGGATALAVHAYPYARPAPLVYVPAGQSASVIGDVPEGWRTATSGLTRWFETHAPEPVVAPATDTRDDPIAASAPTTPWLPIGLGAGAVLLAISLPMIMRMLRRPGDLKAS